MIEKKRKPNLKGWIFKTALIFCLFSILPDLFCPYFINDYMRKNAPEGYYVVGLRDYWKMIVGGIICQTSKRLIEILTKPFFLTIAKDNDNAILREIYAKKAS